MENQYNRRGTSKAGNKKGAFYNKQKGQWYSMIRVAGKRIYLGTFADEDTAHAAYASAAISLHGEFARLR